MALHSTTKVDTNPYGVYEGSFKIKIKLYFILLGEVMYRYTKKLVEKKARNYGIEIQ